MQVKLNITEIKVAQEWDEDSRSLVATIKLKAKVDTKDLSDLGYLQSCPPPTQCSLSTDQLPMKAQLPDVDKDTGEIEE
jgi:hypothetical protein